MEIFQILIQTQLHDMEQGKLLWAIPNLPMSGVVTMVSELSC